MHSMHTSMKNKMADDRTCMYVCMYVCMCVCSCAHSQLCLTERVHVHAEMCTVAAGASRDPTTLSSRRFRLPRDAA